MKRCFNVAKIVKKNDKKYFMELSKKFSEEYKPLCDIINEIDMTKILGKGSQGTVYLYCKQEKCEYAVKISYNCNLLSFLNNRNEMDVNNLAYEHNLSAYKIYDIQLCNDKCITFMDLAKAQTLHDLITDNKISLKEAVILICEKLFELHKLGIYHGDVGFMNILYENNKIKFIDFTIRYDEYKLYYDFIELLFYLPKYEGISDDIIKIVISNAMKEYKNTIPNDFTKLLNKLIIRIYNKVPKNVKYDVLAELALYVFFETDINELLELDEII